MSQVSCVRCGAEFEKGVNGFLCARCMMLDAVGGEAESAASDVEGLVRFGDYELLDEIDRGGMGIVYLARQSSLDRVVALKMLRGEVGSKPDMVKRFRREAEVAASLKHPAIVPVYEVGEVEGQLYYTMEYVDGRDLGSISANRPMPVDRAARYVRAIAEAVHYAHKSGILHRDLKPSNILIDADDCPRVTDFGLVKRMDDLSDLTVAGQILGTPNYLAPEQATGSQADVGVLSEVYSLGAILYELCTGRPPFLSDSLSETILQIREKEVPSPRMLNQAVPRDLENICLKCLEKEPEKRYRSAQALAEDLERFLAHEPVRARPIHLGNHLMRFGRRKPAIAALSCALLFVASIGLGAVLWQLKQVREERDRNREQVVRLNVLSGMPHLLDGDYFKALPWFAKALEQSGPETKGFETQKHRIASLLEASPRLVMVLSHEEDPISYVDFSPTDDRLATTGRDRTVRGWDAVTGEQLMKSPRFSLLPQWVEFSSSGQWLLVSVTGIQSMLQPVDSKSGAFLGDPILHEPVAKSYQSGTHYVYPVCHPSESLIALRTTEGQLRFYDIEASSFLGKPLDHPVEILRMGFDGSGQNLWVEQVNGRVKRWECPTGIARELPFDGADYDVDIYPTDGTATVVVRDRIWHAGSARLSANPLRHDLGIRWANLGPGGNRVLTAGLDKRVRIWDARTGFQLASTIPHFDKVEQGCFSPDGSKFLSLSAFQQIRVWDADSGASLTPPIPHVISAAPSAFSRSGRFLVTVHPSRAGYVWDLDRRSTPPAILPPPFGKGAPFRRAEEGNQITGEYWGRNPQIRGVRLDGRGEWALNIMSQGTAPTQQVLDKSGRFVLIEGERTQVQVWDVETGLPLTPMIASRYANELSAKVTVSLPKLEIAPSSSVDTAQLLAGGRFDASGGWKTLTLREILDRWDAVQKAGWKSLGVSAKKMDNWHREQARLAESVLDWSSAVFHWGCLAEIKPRDQSVLSRIEYAQACLEHAHQTSENYVAGRRVVPLRDPSCVPQQLDLSDYYLPTGEKRLRGNHVQSPVGNVRINDIPFDLRGRVIPRDFRNKGSISLPVGQSLQRLHLVHDLNWRLESDVAQQVCRLVVDFSDGSNEVFSVQYGQHILEGISTYPFKPSEALVAFVTSDRWLSARKDCWRAFRTEWTNPSPNKIVNQIRIDTKSAVSGYRIHAITIE